MTTYSIKNGGHLNKAFRVYGGHEIVRAGEEAEVTTTEPLTDEQLAALAGDGVKVSEKKAKAPEPAPAGPTAVHRGGGSYSVMEGDQELAEKLTKEQAEEFNKLDAEAKAKFVADRKAA